MNLLTTYLLVLTLQLGDDSFSAREAAQASLVAAGPLAYPVLLHALDSPDPEIRHRARHLVRRQLETVPGPLVLPTAGGPLPVLDRK